MKGLTQRLSKGRSLVAVLGFLIAAAGSTVATTPAHADWRGGGYSDRSYEGRDRHQREWQGERWRRIREAREWERRREASRHRRWLERQYYDRPAYYAPAPRYYSEPSINLGFGFTFR